MKTKLFIKLKDYFKKLLHQDKPVVQQTKQTLEVLEIKWPEDDEMLLYHYG